MRKVALILAGAGVMLAGSALSAREKLTGEQQLAKMLEGRVAEKPVSCISYSPNREARVIDKTAIVYDSGNVVYVNRTVDPERLDSDDVLISHIWGSQLCRQDIVRTMDRGTFFQNGFIGLNDFVPYRKVRQGS